MNNIRVRMILVVATAAMAGALYGYDLGIINAAMLYIGVDIPMTDAQLSVIASAVFGGGVIAIFVSGPLADKFGRKPMMFVGTVIFLIGVAFLVHAESYTSLLLGRIGQGLGVGTMTLVIPLYLAEVTPTAIRGRSTATFQLMLTAGILISALVGYFYAQGDGDWRSMFLSCAYPAVVFGVGCLFIPESPRWLAQKGQLSKVKEALKSCRVRSEVESEYEAIVTASNNTKEKTSFKALLNPRYTFPLFIAISIAILNQLTGIAPILQFSAVILKESGSSSNMIAIIGSIWITVMNFGATIVGMVLVDKLGRKPLLSIGTLGAALSLLVAAAAFFGMSSGGSQSLVVIGSIMMFVVFFAIGPGVCVWLALSELLPSAVRSNGMALALALNALAASTFSGLFLYLGQTISFGFTFVLCAVFCLVYFAIAKFIMPETKGKTLEEIECYFNERYDAKNRTESSVGGGSND
ncbi:sugar porter family MFS transporter [Vibrio minamisatsumaniensis]|uniref:sugar porter family MFS transporter n=1 Tax=Vibrio minamisatsumaniensis TaxID=2910243 RepID=UPI003D1FA611